MLDGLQCHLLIVWKCTGRLTDRENLLAQFLWKTVKLVPCKTLVAGIAVVFPIAALSSCWVSAIDAMRAVTHLGDPAGATGPQPRALAVWAFRIHAVVHAYVWQTLDTWPRSLIAIQIERVLQEVKR